MASTKNNLAFRTITDKEDFTHKQQEHRQHSLDIGAKIVEEGCVLLKNDGILPLKTKKVNVFGALAAQPWFGGRGSSCANNSRAIGFFTALEQEGISYNRNLYNLYKNWVKKKKASPAEYPPEKTVYEFKPASVLSTIIDVFSKPYLKELPASALTDGIMEQAKAYSDTALIVLGRSGSEQHDMTAPELGLLPAEEAMIERVCKTFENVIVILNSAGVFELGFTEKYESVKGVLSIGFPARSGMASVAKLLCGKATPSGRLTDTWYYHTVDHPAYKNTGTFKYKNTKKRCFLMYKEDIYVGYRYTETFLSENVYGKKVQFPFGYGLSYTDFAWSEARLTRHDNGLTMDLNVKNTGPYPGKDVVEIFVRAPYTGKIEKAEKVLAAFQKTALLQPGETQRLSINIPFYHMMSFDTKRGAYVLEKGRYGILLSRNAHAAVQELPYEQSEELVYTQDSATAAPIKRRFAAYEGNFRRLSRKDVRRQEKDDRQGGSAAILPDAPLGEDYTADEHIQKYPNMKEPPAKVGVNMPVTGAEHHLLLKDLKAKGWDDPLWDTYLDQFTVDEMIRLVIHGGYQTTENARLGIPGTIASDGPAGIHDSVTARSGISYPSGTVIASTWNPELAKEFGEAVGTEATFMNVHEWYGPSMNLHRGPFGGRCFEYLSEDPLLTGKIVAQIVSGAQSKGLACHIKHFALNEEDKQRMNVHTWCSEQAIREIYCKPFEHAVKEGGAVGVMSGLNCIGGDWCGENKALLTGLLREEWGFHGCVVTDYAAADYQRADTGVPAGNNLWLAPMNNQKFEKPLRRAYAADPAGITNALRESVKGICYMVLRTHAMK